MTGQQARRGGFEWECPFCGTSRLNKADEEAGLENAIAALRSHILASAGAGHGPQNGHPSDYDALDPAEHVERVDRQR